MLSLGCGLGCAKKRTHVSDKAVTACASGLTLSLQMIQSFVNYLKAAAGWMLLSSTLLH